MQASDKNVLKNGLAKAGAFFAQKENWMNMLEVAGGIVGLALQMKGLGKNGNSSVRFWSDSGIARLFYIKMIIPVRRSRHSGKMSTANPE